MLPWPMSTSHIRARAALALASTLALLMAGCDGGAEAASVPAPGEFVTETLANGTTLVRHGPLDELPVTHVLEPDLVLGELDAPEEEHFSQVSGLSVDSRGQIHVLDLAARHVRVFGPDGAWLRTLSRAGEGPGEIQSGNALLHDAEDLLWVHDASRRALMALDREGREVGSAPAPVLGMAPTSRVMQGLDGRFHELTRIADPITAGSQSSGLVETSGQMALLSSTPGGQRGDTLFLSPISNRLYMAGEEGRQIMVTVPAQSSFYGALDPEGHLWTSAGHGRVGEFGLVKMTLAGDTLLRVEAAVERPRVDQADHREWAERIGSTEILRHLPESGPTISGIVADDQGRIWVERAGGRPPLSEHAEDDGPAGTVWDVFDGEGRWMGGVRSGPTLVTVTRPVRIRDGAMYGISRGEMNEERVVRMPIPELSPPG
ncbi:MAG: hypothetical protein EA352_04240 [Gemmatimonadales bacterium]|nr:MAG: hypothetical protein EA352_04240 [Gemmatimonadales bacterium]